MKKCRHQLLSIDELCNDSVHCNIIRWTVNNVGFDNRDTRVIFIVVMLYSVGRTIPNITCTRLDGLYPTSLVPGWKDYT